MGSVNGNQTGICNQLFILVIAASSIQLNSTETEVVINTNKEKAKNYLLQSMRMNKMCANDFKNEMCAF